MDIKLHPEKLLIFRPDNIGDVVLFSGTLRHIRNLYRESRITLAVQPQIVNLVELCPYVDKVISMDTLKTSFKRRFFPRVNSYDLLIFPVKSPDIEHLKIIANLKAKEVAGIIGCDLNEPSTGFPEEFQPERIFSKALDISGDDPWRHEMDTTIDFLRFLGCEIMAKKDVLPEFWLSETDRNPLAGEKARGEKIIGISPGAVYEIRWWKPEKYKKLLNLKNGGKTFVIFGSGAEVPLCQRVEEVLKEGSSAARVVNLAGKTTLRELVKSISKCDLFIGVESAALHMAISLGIPTVGIAGGGHFGRFVPWGDLGKNLILTNRLECFNCNWICVKERVECIEGIKPEDVLHAAKRLMDSIS